VRSNYDINANLFSHFLEIYFFFTYDLLLLNRRHSVLRSQDARLIKHSYGT